MRVRALIRCIAAAMLAVGAAAAASVAGAQAGGSVPARIVNFDFAPQSLTVKAGQTVVWTNGGDRPHTVTDRGGAFDTGPIAPGKTGSLAFMTPGRYLFFCRINPGRMNGVLVVEPAPEQTGAPSAARIQALDPGRPGESLRFDPTDVTLPAGSTVTLANVGGKPHTLTADDGTFDTGVVPPGSEGGKFAGANASIVLAKPGRYPFHCEIHPQAMKGVLTVTGTAAAEAPPPPSEAPADVKAKIADFQFEPPEQSVAPSGKVTFTNVGKAPHTATFDDVPLDTKRLESGASATLTAPDKPGSYSYFCAVHPSMKGVLVVLGQNTKDPAPTAAAPPGGGGKKAARNGGLLGLGFLTGVGAAFLAGLGVGAFLRRKPAATAV